MSEPISKGEGTRWPFFVLFAFMWTGMIGTTLNSDPIKPGFSFGSAVIMLLILAALIALAWARWRKSSIFGFHHETVLGNLGWHAFVLTGIVFLSYLFFDALIQMLMLQFHVAVFEPGCAVSERDTALLVWEAMAKGALKFLATYLHIPAATCTPNLSSWPVTATMQVIRWYTALVVVWHVLSFVLTWFRHVKGARS